MATTKTLEDIITEQASIVCEQIEAAVSFAESEEDLRTEIEKAIEVFRKEADLPELRGHHEVTIGKGRADSVYDYVFIEYKKPGRLKESNDAPGNREVIKQLQERAKAFKSELKRDPKELFGVGTDGNYFITARYRSGRWEISPARERSVHVVEDFLRKLSSLGVAGKPFLPGYLAGDFGAESERKLARDGIGKLYRRIREVEKKPDEYPKVKVLFDQWRILFGEVCGYDIKNPSSKIKQLGEFYGVKKDPNAAALLFAVHSYYALFMKFLAAEIATMFSALSTSFLARVHQTGSPEKLREELRDLEDGGIYRQLGIKNFLEGDLFSWYLDAWDGNTEKIIRDMVACLDEYDPKTLSIDPVESRDLLKKLYQQLFPKTVRHDLGEYYTPDWLADLVIERVGYDGDPNKRILDPACGSGTFLVMAINKVREYADKHLIPKHELLSKILNNIVGFDLNPLAVMAARTNYLLALRELLKLGGEIEIPVYLCDSIMTPAEYGELITKEGTATGGIGKVQELKTSAARFMIPTEIAHSRQTVAGYTDELEHCVRNDYTEDEFISRLKGERIPVDSAELHKALYRQVLKLKKQNQNDIWARIIKNSFAPLFIEPVDYVIGNPPWIRWSYLPEEYRDQGKHLWRKYGLLAKKGLQAIMGTGELDFSMLFTYACVDSYLPNDGKMGFLITQEVVKSKGAGEGFRRFKLGLEGAPFKVCRFDDFVKVRPFEAGNKASLIIIQKGKETEYPLPYFVWKKRPGVREVDSSLLLDEVLKLVQCQELLAKPINTPTSSWQTASVVESEILEKLKGLGSYKARCGVSVDPYGVFIVKINQVLNEDDVLVSNMPELGDADIPKLPPQAVEHTYLYPAIRGKDIRKWTVEPVYAAIIINRSTKHAEIPSEQTVKNDTPQIYSFLYTLREFALKREKYWRYFAKQQRFDTPLPPEKQGKDQNYFRIRQYLREGGVLYDVSEAPFYTLFNVGPYSFAPFKVVWQMGRAE